MSVTILYPHPARPDEAGISYAPDDAYAAALKERLVRRGYEVVETVPAPNTKSTFTADRPYLIGGGLVQCSCATASDHAEPKGCNINQVSASRPPSIR